MKGRRARGDSMRAPMRVVVIILAAVGWVWTVAADARPMAGVAIDDASPAVSVSSDDLSVIKPAADSLDAGLFAPELYLRGLRKFYSEVTDRGAEPDGETPVVPAKDDRPSVWYFREAAREARAMGPEIVRLARARHDAVLALVGDVHADIGGGPTLGAAESLAALAERSVTQPAVARALWQESIDSLAAALEYVTEARIVRDAHAPAVPLTLYDACPYEGCLYRIWFAKEETTVHVTPDSASSAAFAIRKDEAVLGVTGILIVTKLGRCVPEQGTGEDPEHLPSSPVTVLGYEGEGFYRALVGGKIEILGCDWRKGMVNPEYVWWAMVQNRAGQIGWVVGAARGALAFENQDAHGFVP